MTQNKNSKARREQIMNSGKSLPGDPARADDEEKNGSFDSDSSGNFDLSTADHQAGDPLRREEINESKSQLEGDTQRGDDDESFDETGKSLKNAKKSSAKK